jgi:SAM-dependent methyltransferase
VSLRDAWDRRAEAWAAFARTPGHDVWYERLNLPAFLSLLPPPGEATLDLGCGEGRVGAVLAQLGHRVTGVEASAALAALAREHHEVVDADAAALPFPDRSFDLVLAFMSLHDMDDLPKVVAEAARVLVPHGRFCFAVEHPFQKAGGWVDADDPASPFVVDRAYLAERRSAAVVDRDGVRMEFVSADRPLDAYGRALAAAGLLVEAVREPVPDEELVRERPRMAKWRRIPIFLHVRCRPSAGVADGPRA